MGLALTKVWQRLVGKREFRLAMLGLDGAGKTTMLYKLKLGEVVETIPTIGFNVEAVEHRNLTLTVWDVGGQDRARTMWRTYYCHSTSGLVFVVDSGDRSRMDEARDELRKVLEYEQLREAPVLVIANKQDLPTAMTAAEISERLDMEKIPQKEWYIQSACAMSGEGLFEGLDWLSRKLASRR